MPELPEVETVKNALAPHLKGREVKSISFFTPKLRQELDENLFNKLFSNYKILDLKRRSKYLIFKIIILCPYSSSVSGSFLQV